RMREAGFHSGNHCGSVPTAAFCGLLLRCAPAGHQSFSRALLPEGAAPLAVRGTGMKPTENAGPAPRPRWSAVPLVSPAVLRGAARRHRRRQALLHGAVDILGIGAAAVALAVFGEDPSVEHPWTPDTWGASAIPTVIAAALCYLAATRALLWYAVAAQNGG